jgi:hypothetical protein
MAQILREGDRVAIKLEQNDDMVAEITRISSDEGIHAGFIVMGIGMIKSIRLGYWDGVKYVQRVFEEPHELLSLQGSIADVDGVPHAHMHVAIAARDNHVYGGHLFAARVNVVNEILIEMFPGKVFDRPKKGPLLRELNLCPLVTD